MARPAILLVLGLMAVVGGARDAPASARLALVIGNADYRNTAPLKNPANDARIVSRAMAEVGFEVETRLDVDGPAFRRSFLAFSRRLAREQKPLSIFYFAGNGVQISGVNYLLPVDADGTSPSDLERSSVDLAWVIKTLRDANPGGLNVVVLDACRDDPFAARERGTRALAQVGRGLARVETDFGDRTVVIYSTRAGGVAMDGEARGSPFALAFAASLVKPGLEFIDFFREVQYGVLTATAGLQKPELFGIPPRAVYFVAARPGASPPAPGPADPYRQLDPRTRAGRVLLADEAGRLKPTYDESYALLIGVSDYENEKEWPALPGVKSDLDQVARVLEENHGFKVTRVDNPTGIDLEIAFKKFIRVHGPKENARILIYFAGHGATTTNGASKIGWLVPADAPHAGDAPEVFATTALPMQRIEEYSVIIKAKHVLWVFDSCFSGAVFNLQTRGDTPSHWERHLLTNRIRRIITSGSENERVPDQSVFARLFVEALAGETPVGDGDGLITGSELATFLKQNVINYMRETQTPQHGTVRIKGLDAGDIVFKLEQIPVTSILR